MKERRYDIDWLRIVAILAVFFFHCARFFGGGDWHLVNNEQGLVATLFIGLLDLWIMPLFFLLSGAGSWYALKSRTGGQYLFLISLLVLPLLLYLKSERGQRLNSKLAEFCSRWGGIFLFLIPLAVVRIFFIHFFAGESFSLRYMLFQIVMSAATWSWVSFILIMALYELLVRRFNAIRFLFGMRLTKRAIGEQPAGSR